MAFSMLASELQDLIVGRLVRNQGSSSRRWRMALGPIRIYSVKTHPDINWLIEPRGTARENSVIEQLLDELRLNHPIVEADT